MYKILNDERQKTQHLALGFEALKLQMMQHKYLIQILHSQENKKILKSFKVWQQNCITIIQLQKQKLILRLINLICQKQQSYKQYCFMKISNDSEKSFLQIKQKTQILKTVRFSANLEKIYHNNIQCGLTQMRNYYQYKLKEDVRSLTKQQLIVNLSNKCVLKQLKRGFTKFKYNCNIQKHSQMLINKLICNYNRKSKQIFITYWRKIIQQIKTNEYNSILKQKQQCNTMRQIVMKQQKKNLISAFNKWKDYYSKALQQEKFLQVQFKFKGLNKIVTIFNNKSNVSKFISIWKQKAKASRQLQKCLIFIKKQQLQNQQFCIDIIKSHNIEMKKIYENNRTKGNFLNKIFTTIIIRNQQQAFQILRNFSIYSKLNEDQEKIDNLKAQLKNQIDELIQRDNKVKSKETFLQQKEKGILEHEKGLTEKSRRLLELSKALQHNKKYSPKKLRQQSKNSRAFNNTNLQNQFQSKSSHRRNQNPQLQSMTQPQTIFLTVDENDNLKQVPKLEQASSSQFNSNLSLTRKVNKTDKIDNQKLQIKTLQQQAVSTSYSKENQTLTSTISIKKSLNDKNIHGIMKYSPRNQTQIQQYTQMPLQNQKSSKLFQNLSNHSNLSKKQEDSRQGQQKVYLSLQLDEIKSPKYQQAILLEKAQAKILNLTQKNQLKRGFNSFKNNINMQVKKEVARFVVNWQNKKILSVYMIKWLRSIYADEIDTHENIQMQRERQLLRALLITQRSMQRPQNLKAEAFKIWKRTEYQQVLDGLRKYSALLDKNQLQNILTTTDDMFDEDDDDDEIFLCTDEQEEFYDQLPSSRSNRVYLTTQ